MPSAPCAATIRPAPRSGGCGCIPTVQRRGHGRAILRRLEARARELGVQRLFLDTTERQLPAIALYLAEGFTETGRGQVLGFPCVFLAKELGAAG